MQTDVEGLRTDIQGLRTDVNSLNGRISALNEEVREILRIGGENLRQLKLIAEVQSHHGTVLEQHSRLLNQLVKDIEPLKVLPDLVSCVRSSRTTSAGSRRSRKNEAASCRRGLS